MKLIGIEEHFLTTEVKDAWSAIGLEAADPSVAFHGGPLEKRLADLAEERLSLMDETDWTFRCFRSLHRHCTILDPAVSIWRAVPMMPWQKRYLVIRIAFRRWQRCP